MKTQSFQWGNVTGTIYYLDRGEQVPRHQHAIEHLTMVIAGQSAVQIFDGREPQAIVSGNTAMVLPAGVDHVITALEDGTIVLNVIKGAYGVATDTGLEAMRGTHGGVAHEDGTVTPHGA